MGFSDDGKKLQLIPGTRYIKEVMKKRQIDDKNLLPTFDSNKKTLPPLYFSLLEKQEKIYKDDGYDDNRNDISNTNIHY